MKSLIKNSIIVLYSVLFIAGGTSDQQDFEKWLYSNDELEIEEIEDL